MAITFQDTVVGLVQNVIEVRQHRGTGCSNVIAVVAVPDF